MATISTLTRTTLSIRSTLGIARAKKERRFKGRPSAIKDKSEQIKDMVSQGIPKTQIARKFNIGEASMYRVLKLG